MPDRSAVEAKDVSAPLRSKLEDVAALHHGKVPIHGRLFAQWLHYVFPRECPFPHKVGTHSAQSPLEFGDNYIASESEVHSHASNKNSAEWQADTFDEERWMSQWSE